MQSWDSYCKYELISFFFNENLYFLGLNILQYCFSVLLWRVITLIIIVLKYILCAPLTTLWRQSSEGLALTLYQQTTISSSINSFVLLFWILEILLKDGRNFIKKASLKDGIMIHIHIYLVKWLLDTWVHYLVTNKIKVHFCWWNMNIYLSDFLDGLWIFCFQPLNHLVQRVRRPARAPKAVNEADHQILFCFCYGSHSLCN